MFAIKGAALRNDDQFRSISFDSELLLQENSMK